MRKKGAFLLILIVRECAMRSRASAPIMGSLIVRLLCCATSEPKRLESALERMRLELIAAKKALVSFESARVELARKKNKCAKESCKARSRKQRSEASSETGERVVK